MPEFKCPVCDGTVQVPEDALDGELFEYAECGVQLELVTSEGRRILRLAEEVGEDWGE